MTAVEIRLGSDDTDGKVARVGLRPASVSCCLVVAINSPTNVLDVK